MNVPAQYNFCILKTEYIIDKAGEDILSDLIKYNIYDASKGVVKINTVVRRIILHNLILCLCSAVLSTKAGVPIVLVHDTTHTSDIFQDVFDSRCISTCINAQIRRITNLMPVCIYAMHASINNLKDGALIDELNLIRGYSERHKQRSGVFTFLRIRNFAHRNGLTFLDRNYFMQLKTKQLLMA